VAVAGYLAAMLINPNNHALDGGPATAAMEKEAVRELAAMFRYPGEHLGHLTTSGTIANLEALFVARELHPGSAVAVSAEAHYTHERMGHVLGLDTVRVAVDDLGRMDLEALERLLRAGGIGTVVVTAGTTGLGAIDPRASLSPAGLRPGDRILLSGRVGDHGTAIMLARGEFELGAEIESDTRSLWPAVDALLDAAGPALRCLRDATRGGVASVLNELARASGVAMLVREADVPVHPAVAGAAELLGIDPMYVANEGKLVAFVAPEAAGAALAALRATPGCEDAADIGEVRTEPPTMVLVETAFGGRRVMDQLVGDPLPRIC
jgi:hydrogenase expression/formation protein HypE